MKIQQSSPRDRSRVELLEDLLAERDRSSRLLFEKVDLERSEAAARAELRLIRGSGSSRLGSALVDAMRSPRALIGLPGTLWKIWKHLRARASEGAEDRSSPSLAMLAQAVQDSPLREPAPAPAFVHDLRIASVLDEFTYECFSPECQIVNLPVDGFEQVLDAVQPHFLLVESAWRGANGEWRGCIHPMSGKLAHLVGCCRRRAIPTIFWNKEDPSHFENFLDSARLFDHVFTTDERCVPRYKEALGHGRVHVLGFACQPLLHNPLEEEGRGKIASFAGSWYAQYPERSRDFENLVNLVGNVVPVEIYDRNAGRGDPAFQYPAHYQPMVRRAVPYRKIGEVYKSGVFAMTLNTVKDSPTMLARRVHELLASNTVTISNYSLAVDRVYGDRVLMLERDHCLGSRLEELRDNEEAQHRFRLRGLREVLSQHVASRRLATIADAAIGNVAVHVPSVCVVSRVASRSEAASIIAMFNSQRWENRTLILVAKPEWIDHDMEVEGVQVIGVHHSGTFLQPEWVSLWNPRDYYGPCYLLDLLLAASYAGSSAIGKSTRFVVSNGAPALVRMDPQYSSGAVLPIRASVIKASALRIETLRDLVTWAESSGDDVIGVAIDEFGYCQDGAGAPREGVDVD